MKLSSLILLFFSLSISLGLAELALRTFRPGTGIPELPKISEVDPYTPNPYVFKFRPFLWSYIPGAQFLQVRGARKIPYLINSSGFRGVEIPKKSESKKRLLVIGDSMVEGQGVAFEQAFPELLSRSLSTRNWEPVNLGVSGASPIYYAANVPRYLSFSPDAVLLVLFENDISEDRVREGEYLSLPILTSSERFLGIDNSVWSRFRIIELSDKLFFRPFKDPLENIVNRNLHQKYNFSPIDREFQNVSPHMVGPRTSTFWFGDSSRYLDYIRQELKGRKIPLLIVSFGFGRFDTQEKESKHREFESNFNLAAQKWSEKRRIPYFCLQQAVDSLIENHPLDSSILPEDGHPTAEAHQAFSEAIGTWLATKLAN